MSTTLLHASTRGRLLLARLIPYRQPELLALARSLNEAGTVTVTKDTTGQTDPDPMTSLSSGPGTTTRP